MHGHTKERHLLLEVEGLKTHFALDDGLVRAVDGVDFQIEQGKTLCVVGESGCGKSVMARSILQIVSHPGRIVDGRIRFHRRKNNAVSILDLASLAQWGPEMRDIRGQDIAMIFQEPMTSFSPVHTVGEQIIESLRLHLPITPQEARERTIDLLSKVGIPRAADRVDTYTFQLSGGMRQRAMIAMALACNPSLLIADEPTTALDVTTQAQIIDLLLELQAEYGMSMLFITHDLGVVAELADDVAVMYLGVIVERGPVDSIFHDPKHPYTRALLRSLPTLGLQTKTRLNSIRGMVPDPYNRPNGCPFHTRCDDFMPGVCDRIMPSRTVLPDGREVRCLLYEGHTGSRLASPLPIATSVNGATPQHSEAKGARSPQELLLQVDGLQMLFPVRRGPLRRTHGHVRAVDDVSFTIYQGETLGLVGESGCGKTTTGRCIIRHYEPTAGQILYRREGGDVVDLTPLSKTQLKPYRQQVRMIFQDPYSSLNPRLPVLDIIGEPLKVNRVAKGRAVEARVAELLQHVGLRPEYIRRYPHAFSGGERQRIGIARALALNPRLIVCDEAVSALDVSVRAQILNLLQDLQKEYNLTYLFIAHDLSVVEHICDRVAVMYLGKIVELAETRALYTTPKHPYTEALLSAVPKPDPRLRDRTRRIVLEGEVPDPANPPSGCYFHTRCRYSDGKSCVHEAPSLHEIEPGHYVACHYAAELTLRSVVGEGMVE